MAGLVPAIYATTEVADGRHQAGHDVSGDWMTAPSPDMAGIRGITP
jgi:hypothetical protein